MPNWETIRRRWPEIAEQPTQQRKVTRRNEVLIDAGVHPATYRPLDWARTCGSCVHLRVHTTAKKRFYKCGLVPVTFGAATDVRISWPACVDWELANA